MRDNVRTPRKQISSYQERTFDPFVSPAKGSNAELHTTLKDKILSQLDGRVVADSRSIAPCIGRLPVKKTTKPFFESKHACLFENMTSIQASAKVEETTPKVVDRVMEAAVKSPGKRELIHEIESPKKRQRVQSPKACAGAAQASNLPVRTGLLKLSEKENRAPLSGTPSRRTGHRTCRLPRPGKRRPPIT